MLLIAKIAVKYGRNVTGRSFVLHLEIFSSTFFESANRKAETLLCDFLPNDLIFPAINFAYDNEM